MDIANKLLTVAENEQKVAELNTQLGECLGGGTVSENDVISEVYKAGQQSMVDETKLIRKTVRGVGVGLSDISEIPHDIDIKLVSDNVTDFSNIKVSKLGTNNYKMGTIHGTASQSSHKTLGNNSVSVTAIGGSGNSYVFRAQLDIILILLIFLL